MMKNRIDNKGITKEMKKFLIGYIRIVDESLSVRHNYFHKNSDTVYQMKELGFCDGNGFDLETIFDSMNNQERNDLGLQVWYMKDKERRCSTL